MPVRVRLEYRDDARRRVDRVPRMRRDEIGDGAIVRFDGREVDVRNGRADHDMILINTTENQRKRRKRSVFFGCTTRLAQPAVGREESAHTRVTRG